MAKTYVALNHVDLAGGTACGSCIWFRGTGENLIIERTAASSQGHLASHFPFMQSQPDIFQIDICRRRV
jgi:hypothetical protein